MTDPAARHTFEIALVGAGAISAGAYTGGVVDFMTSALDAWYAAKEAGDPDAPPHQVRLGVFAGASAGAITAALSAAYLCSDQPPIATPEDAKLHRGKNKLFDSWVDRIDISHLLRCDDLQEDGAPVVSLLDSTVLSSIADSGLDVPLRPLRRGYVAPTFELLLTVTNLRGVPYGFNLSASGRDSSYDMALHADYVHFSISDGQAAPASDRYSMRWADFSGPSPLKDKLKQSALASSAFPVGLAPRMLSHEIDLQPDWYSARSWPIPSPHSCDPHVCVTSTQIPAKWGSAPQKFSYSFQCVDGGVMDNEPFELARKQLAGRDGRNERDGEKARKAVLMIDPFPSDAGFDSKYQAAPDVLSAAFRLFGALKQQARFKPEELMLAAHEDVASRYMISPSRDGQAFPIACGSLGGFGGFLKRAFREHDYFLARRNAQKFFDQHFVLPENNPLFEQWSPAQRARYCVKDEQQQPVHKDGQRLLPIIPLMGAAKAECAAPAWPQYDAEDLARLLAQAELRTDAVISRLLDQYLQKNVFLRLLSKFVARRKRGDLVARLGKAISEELAEMQLMRAQA